MQYCSNLDSMSADPTAPFSIRGIRVRRTYTSRNRVSLSYNGETDIDISGAYEVPTTQINHDNITELHNWCDENLKSFWVFSSFSRLITFDEDDAILIRLRWG